MARFESRTSSRAAAWPRAGSAQASIAPFRLGLTATLERGDGAHAWIDELVGPVVTRLEITDLEGDFLAEYRTECIRVHLSAEDREAYELARGTYRAFVDSQGLSGPSACQRFVQIAARSSSLLRASRK